MSGRSKAAYQSKKNKETIRLLKIFIEKIERGQANVVESGWWNNNIDNSISMSIKLYFPENSDIWERLGN